MRRIVAVALGLLLIASVLAVTGGKKKPSSKKTGKLAVGHVIMEFGHPYQQAFFKWGQIYAKELGIDYTPLDSKTDPKVQTNIMEDLTAKNVDGIIIQPIDVKGVVTSIEEAKDAGIAVVGWGSKPIPNNQPFVELDEHKVSASMGALAAKKWLEFYPNKPIKIGTINIPGLEVVDVHRVQAFVEGVKSVAPKAEWVVDLNGKGLRDVSYAAGEDMLQSHPEVNIVYGSNADMALGCLAAFEAAGRGRAINGKPLTEIFVGTDGAEPEMLKIADPNSSFKVTMALLPRENAKACIDTLLGIINKKIDMNDGNKIVPVADFLVNGWEASIKELNDFIKDQYFSTLDLKKELGL
jgi:ABC-type sugar transport system substrate-binding protein